MATPRNKQAPPAKRPRQKKAVPAKAPAKRGRASAPATQVHVQVLQNGATLAAAAVPLKRRGTLALTSNGRGPFVLPHYPLPQGRLEFLRFERDGVTLTVDFHWEGFATSKGEPVDLMRASKGRRFVTLYKGDYATLVADNLRLMLKVGPPQPRAGGGRRGTNPAYRRSFLAHFLPSIHEKRATLGAAVAALVILGAGTMALLKRPVHRPEALGEIDEQYLMPFVAPDHLRHAPEALQEGLDRSHEARSVLNFYQAFTAVMLGKDPTGPGASLVYPTTIDLYHRLHAGARLELAAKIDHQKEVDRLQEMKSGTSVLAIPAVLGESESGSMLRIIDKIGVMQQGFAEALAARREVTQTYPADPEYTWEEYKNVSPHMALTANGAAILKNMSGAFRGLTDEEHMYSEAEGLARRANGVQARIRRHRGGSEAVTADSTRPIGMPDGVKFASFTGDLDFRVADEKLYQLQGSEFGARQAKLATAPHPQEALIGEIEPALIERYIKENRFQLQLCYELALRRNEAAAGTMEWSWRIDSRGVISDIALVTSSIQDNKMAECIHKKIATWRFPRPRRGSVEVSYPFEFAPSKG